MASLRKVALESDLELCANPASLLSGYVSRTPPHGQDPHTLLALLLPHTLSCAHSSPPNAPLFLLSPWDHTPLLPAPVAAPPRLILERSQRLLSQQCWGPTAPHSPPFVSGPQPISRQVPGLAIRDQSWCLAGLHGCPGTFDPDSGLGGTTLPPGEAGARSATQLGFQRGYSFLFLLLPPPAAPPHSPSPRLPPPPPSLAKSRRREVWPAKEPAKRWGWTWEAPSKPRPRDPDCSDPAGEARGPGKGCRRGDPRPPGGATPRLGGLPGPAPLPPGAGPSAASQAP